MCPKQAIRLIIDSGPNRIYEAAYTLTWLWHVCVKHKKAPREELYLFLANVSFLTSASYFCRSHKMLEYPS